MPMTAHEALLINNRGSGQRIGTDPVSIEPEDAEVAVDGAQRSAGVPRTSGVIDDGAGNVRQARLANGTFATAGGYA
jgi:hypothetical protein